MKRLFTFLWAASFILVSTAMTGCSDEPKDKSDDKEEQQFKLPEGKTPEYSVIEKREYTNAQLIDHAFSAYSAFLDEKTYGMLKFLLGGNSANSSVFHEDVIKYTSVDHKGNPIDLSGIVCYVTGDAKKTTMRQIVLDSHATITDNASAPTSSGSVVELLMIKSNCVVIAADYQGYGVSKAALHPYLNEDLTARQQSDMMKASMKYLTTEVSSIKFDDNIATYCVGYSQGGAAALALHRQLETIDAAWGEALGLRGSICGDGPYNLLTTLQASMQQPTVSIPVILPMMVRSMIECYPEYFNGMALNDFFTDQFLAAGGGLINLMDQKLLNPLAFNMVFGAEDPLDAKMPITSILKAEALAPGSPQMMAIVQACLRNNCITGWQPKGRVCFFHSQADNVVTYANLEDAKAWQEGSYMIKNALKDTDHLATALLYYAELLLLGPDQMLTEPLRPSLPF